jgi:hypothetical protein
MGTRTLGRPALLMLLALGGAVEPSEAGVRVRIEPADDGAPALPFVVECRTRSFGIHSTHSKLRDQGVVPAAKWTKLETGLRSPVLFDSVVATAFHPEYRSAWVESDSWLGTLANAPLPVLRPAAWRDELSGAELPANGRGPTRARLADHVRVVEEYYLPVLDRAGIDFGPGAFEALRALVEAGITGAPADDRYAAEGRANLQRLERFLAHPREARILAAGYRGGFGPWPLMEQYFDESDRSRILDFLTTSWPEERRLDWFNEKTGLHYSFSAGPRVNRKESPDHDCLASAVGADAGRAAGLDDERLRATAHTYFCRGPDGRWAQRGRYAPASRP